MEAIGQTSGQLESLMRYCTLVRQRLQTFDAREKQLTLETLDIRVTWTPNEPLAIQGRIPLSDIVPVPSGCRPAVVCCFCHGRHAARRQPWRQSSSPLALANL
jgi:hypothetical protein